MVSVVEWNGIIIGQLPLVSAVNLRRAQFSCYGVLKYSNCRSGYEQYLKIWEVVCSVSRVVRKSLILHS